MNDGEFWGNHDKGKVVALRYNHVTFSSTETDVILDLDGDKLRNSYSECVEGFVGMANRGSIFVGPPSPVEDEE